MTTRLEVFLGAGAILVAAAFFGMRPLLERIYRVEEWHAPWESYGSAAYGNPKEVAGRPHVVFAGPVGKEIVEGWVARSPETLVLRWSNGRLWWGEKALVPDEMVPYVSGLLKAKNLDSILVVIPADSKWSDVVGVIDKMRMVKARVIGLCMEI